MQKELDYLGRVPERPAKPVVAVIGGAKISGKIDAAELAPRQSRPVADRRRDDVHVPARTELYRPLPGRGGSHRHGESAPRRSPGARGGAPEPVDCVASTAPDGSAPSHVVAAESLAADEMGVDIGPASVRRFTESLRDAKTVLWNGPMGIFEVPAFADGTIAIAKTLADATKRGATTIVGGGDSVAAVQQAGLADDAHLSTGAKLGVLEGRTPPGAALDDREP
jgi:phosphoglycerate kinase